MESVTYPRLMLRNIVFTPDRCVIADFVSVTFCEAKKVYHLTRFTIRTLPIPPGGGTGGGLPLPVAA